MIAKPTLVDLPSVDDQDLRWAATLLGLPADAFSDDEKSSGRELAMKSMQSIDVAACPGSGKTTLLVAKLAILSKKWQHRSRGVCVLSHTNVARHQIETRLGDTTAGRSLLSYPHYVGTIHGFVNEFLAIPWLRSNRYPVRFIETAICQKHRWYNIPINYRSFLSNKKVTPAGLHLLDADFNIGVTSIHGVAVKVAPTTETYKSLRAAVIQSSKEGYFCYDDMFVWAHRMLAEFAVAKEALRDRFPLLFVDEAQDNSDSQSAILNALFSAGKHPVVRQRFGDGNQAIYDFQSNANTAEDAFPDEKCRVDLWNSHRFGNAIARLAQPLEVHPYSHAFEGHGPQVKLKSGKEGDHTVFIFEERNCRGILDAYGKLLLDTFSDDEILAGAFCAVGQIHNGREGESETRLPRTVGHYWPQYNPDFAALEPRPKTFVQFVTSGLQRAESTGEIGHCVERVAEGILRAARLGGAEGLSLYRFARHRYVLELLGGSLEAKNLYERLISCLAISRTPVTKESWNACWQSAVEKIVAAVPSTMMHGAGVEEFLSWPVGPSDGPSVPNGSQGNYYRYTNGNRHVGIRVGSIHSVKGETHTATLVLETFWWKYNLDSLLDALCGTPCHVKAHDEKQLSRLRTHYVAMTRPSHLLCLAMAQSTFRNPGGCWNKEAISMLANRGWRFRVIK